MNQVTGRRARADATGFSPSAKSVVYAILRNDWITGRTTSVNWDDEPV